MKVTKSVIVCLVFLKTMILLQCGHFMGIITKEYVLNIIFMMILTLKIFPVRYVEKTDNNDFLELILDGENPLMDWL